MHEHHLIVKHSTSRGRDTMGYSIVAIWEGKNSYKTCGGGYDMLGTVFGQWLYANYKEKLNTLVPYDPQYSDKFYQERGYYQALGNYGLFQYNEEFYLDGACGLSCMISIASKIGLNVKQLRDRKGCYTIGFIVRSLESEAFDA